MPSPFPGMDPYLEAPRLWPGFHNRLATEIAAELNEVLPSTYYADIEVRSELGILEEDESRQHIIPDVAVVRPLRSSSGGVAVLERPRRALSPSLDVQIENAPIRHHFVEIRDARQGHKLITLIEILSPSNKRPGPDREAYRRKQQEILGSDASLIEIDLLRGGEHVLPDPALGAQIRARTPPAAYLVLVSRAWKRAEGVTQVYFSTLREWLPCVAVPLKEHEEAVPLDLQFIVNRAYDGGPYRRGAVNYDQAPDPPLASEDVGWAAELLRADG